MLSMLSKWEGAVDVNGTAYTDVKSALRENKGLTGDVHIVLYPKDRKALYEDAGAVVEGNTALAPQEQDVPQEVEITVKAYMTKKASPKFDFMAKWNNDKPMPLRTMRGVKVKETRGMVYMKLHGMGRPVITCMRCGRELTNPISRKYGIGPECITKLGFSYGIEDVDAITEALADVTWEGWVIKSAITEEVTV